MRYRTLCIPKLTWRVITPKGLVLDEFDSTFGSALNKLRSATDVLTEKAGAKLQYKHNNRWHDAVERMEE